MATDYWDVPCPGCGWWNTHRPGCQEEPENRLERERDEAREALLVAWEFIGRDAYYMGADEEALVRKAVDAARATANDRA